MISYQESSLWEIKFTFTFVSYDSWKFEMMSCQQSTLWESSSSPFLFSTMIVEMISYQSSTFWETSSSPSPSAALAAEMISQLLAKIDQVLSENLCLTWHSQLLNLFPHIYDS